MYNFEELQIRKYNEPGVDDGVIYYKIVKKYIIGKQILKRPLYGISGEDPIWEDWYTRSLKQAYNIAQNWKDTGLRFVYTLKSSNELIEVIPFKTIVEKHSMELI